MPALLALLLLSAPVSAARYVEPESGTRMTIDNMKSRKRILGTDRYCVRDVKVDGLKVWGGYGCKVKHGETRAIRLAPGPRKIALDMMSDFGEDPEIPSEEFVLRVDVSTRDFAVVLRGSKAPEIVFVEDLPAVSTAPLASPPIAPVEAPADPFQTLERLKELHDKGVLDADEYKAKKAEILKSIR